MAAVKAVFDPLRPLLEGEDSRVSEQARIWYKSAQAKTGPASGFHIKNLTPNLCACVCTYLAFEKHANKTPDIATFQRFSGATINTFRQTMQQLRPLLLNPNRPPSSYSYTSTYSRGDSFSTTTTANYSSSAASVAATTVIPPSSSVPARHNTNTVSSSSATKRSPVHDTTATNTSSNSGTKRQSTPPMRKDSAAKSNLDSPNRNVNNSSPKSNDPTSPTRSAVVSTNESPTRSHTMSPSRNISQSPSRKANQSSSRNGNQSPPRNVNLSPPRNEKVNRSPLRYPRHSPSTDANLSPSRSINNTNNIESSTPPKPTSPGSRRLRTSTISMQGNDAEDSITVTPKKDSQKAVLTPTKSILSKRSFGGDMFDGGPFTPHSSKKQKPGAVSFGEKPSTPIVEDNSAEEKGDLSCADDWSIYSEIWNERIAGVDKWKANMIRQLGKIIGGR